MSTEARRAPVPPRPSAPPPGNTPATASAPPAPPAPQGTGDGTEAGPAFTPGEAALDPAARPGAPTPSGPSAAPGTGSGPAVRPGVPAPALPLAEPGARLDHALDTGRALDAAPGPDEEPSVFAPRAARPSGPSAVPEAGAPVSPPPPPASARFPDMPPLPAGPAGTTSSPRLPHRPGPEPSRPTAAQETPSETTTRLRPVPSVPGPTDDAGTPSAPAPPARPAAPAATPGPATAGPGTAGSGTGAPRVPGAAPGWGPSAPAHPGAPRTAATGTPGPALSWSAAAAARPVVSFAEPDTRGPRGRVRTRTVAAAACLVLGLGLVGGAVTGSWLTGGGEDGGTGKGFSAAGTLWHSVPVDQLFPPTVQGTGAGPGGADRTWTRIAVAPDSGCAHAFDPLLRKALAPVGCRRLLRATYADSTQSYVTTVGLMFTKADPAAMSALAARFRDEHLDRRADLMPRPYAAEGTAAAGFGDRQRASWTVSVLTDAPVVAYAVSGWADGRKVDSPQPAADAVRSGATTPAAQSGLGNEAQGLADRIQRRLRQTVSTATEQPS
ncbi:hypothetical protein [Streptomyces sp. NK08204]|uniref:hypothetical protein n=1 Tax=Streptomyces sp. NK08204 TaxID=2873260 RepID=UPI001CEDAB36|nr:hypothetical protein [Streptomyces sp. NK08204]